MNPKTFVLYHGSCADGFGAAWAAWLALGDAATYIAVHYGHPVPTAVEDGSDVLIVDFSYPRAVLEELRGRVRSLVVLDHHSTAKADLAGLDYARFDTSMSGAVLTWRHFFPTQLVPELIRYLQDRDLWQWLLPESKEVSAALRLYPFDFKVWLELAENIDLLRQEGRVALRQVEQQARSLASKAVLRDVGGYTVPVVNATTYISEVGHFLLELNPEAPFSASYFDGADGLRHWSLRARKDFDCSAVAKLFGGGGHPQASGFEETVPDCAAIKNWQREALQKADECEAVVMGYTDKLKAERDLANRRYGTLMTACGEVVSEMRTYTQKRNNWAMQRLDQAMRDADEMKL